MLEADIVFVGQSTGDVLAAITEDEEFCVSFLATVGCGFRALTNRVGATEEVPVDAMVAAAFLCLRNQRPVDAELGQLNDAWRPMFAELTQPDEVYL